MIVISEKLLSLLAHFILYLSVLCILSGSIQLETYTLYELDKNTRIRTFKII